MKVETIITTGRTFLYFSKSWLYIIIQGCVLIISNIQQYPQTNESSKEISTVIYAKLNSQDSRYTDTYITTLCIMHYALCTMKYNRLTHWRNKKKSLCRSVCNKNSLVVNRSNQMLRKRSFFIQLSPSPVFSSQ